MFNTSASNFRSLVEAPSVGQLQDCWSLCKADLTQFVWMKTIYMMDASTFNVSFGISFVSSNVHVTSLYFLQKTCFGHSSKIRSGRCIDVKWMWTSDWFPDNKVFAVGQKATSNSHEVEVCFESGTLLCLSSHGSVLWGALSLQGLVVGSVEQQWLGFAQVANEIAFAAVKFKELNCNETDAVSQPQEAWLISLETIRKAFLMTVTEQCLSSVTRRRYQSSSDKRYHW